MARAADLANGASILHEPASPLEWVRLVLPAGANLLAEGLTIGPEAPEPVPPTLTAAARAWLNTGRTGFVIAGASPHDRLRRRFEERARSLGFTGTTDPALRLLACGTEILPEVTGRVCHFALPRQALEARLVSRTAIPANVMDSADARRLGVPVTGILVNGRTVPLDDWTMRDGWHEPEGAWRWTGGSARLLLPARAMTVEVVIAYVLPRYPWSPSDAPAAFADVVTAA